MISKTCFHICGVVKTATPKSTRTSDALAIGVTILMIFGLGVIDNNFPSVVQEREKSIDKIRANNANLSIENTILESKIQGYTEEDLNLIESKARFKYGLIKEGEYFFKINRIVEKEALPENDKATL